MNSQGAVVQRCGIKKAPPTLVIIYHLGLKTRKRTIPVYELENHSVTDIVSRLRHTGGRHELLLKQLPSSQLFRLITILKDIVQGIPLGESLQRIECPINFPPEEDLNRVDPETLSKIKALMDDEFERNRITPTNPAFEYDKSVDFPQMKSEECPWDSDECES
ncbi:unnamed protein product [Dicrocoelium dendriticum]|nr:unnamed protein product [Dicrocoelium dendriticum]